MLYLIEKILIKFLLLFLKFFFKDEGCFFSKKTIREIPNSNLAFCLNHKNCHLGDQLFFASLFIETGNRAFIFNESEKVFLFEAVGIEQRVRDEKVLTVTTSPALLSFLIKYKKLPDIFIDFNKSNEEVLPYLNFVFSGEKKSKENLLFNLRNFIKKNLQKNLKIQLNKDMKYVFFSNYIYSGFFRKFFVNESLLYEKAKSLKSNGYKIFHIGSKSDKENDKRRYLFIDIDVRGKYSIKDLIYLFSSGNICYVGYDGFWGHISHLFCNKSYILFRGKFTKKPYMIHINFINNFFTRKDIHYLNGSSQKKISLFD